jgi:YggT family protein
MDVIFLLISILRIYEMILFMRILLSWVPVDPNSRPIELLVRVTDPVLAPARELYMRLMDRLNVQLPIDLSPILIFILIGFLERTLASLY